ncbi:CD209 antigen-like protein E [Xiphias gladius]|uniref:CD209 antigen-like protein E n=1 Tax=Xiphias gladius TaxID=8245 RepID=UPI001A995905|nr:CD209 antigen-like protein E [Xiphias gladius]
MVREQSEISMDYINLPDPSAGGFASKSRTGEDSAETPAVSDSQHISLTEERDELKRRLKILGWVYFSGSVYYISSTERTWQESRNDCLQKGADLMIINNQGEQNFTRQFKKYMWMGLR